MCVVNLTNGNLNSVNDWRYILLIWERVIILTNANPIKRKTCKWFKVVSSIFWRGWAVLYVFPRKVCLNAHIKPNLLWPNGQEALIVKAAISFLVSSFFLYMFRYNKPNQPNITQSSGVSGHSRNYCFTLLCEQFSEFWLTSCKCVITPHHIKPTLS